MPKENKVKFGLKNVHYALISQGEDGSITFGTPVAIPGAVSLSMTPQGETTEFYADNILFYATAANTGYQGDLEIALVPQSFRTDVLGEKLDGDSGVMFENAAVEPAPFALLFEFNGDAHATRHILYNCTTARPGVNGSTTNKTKEPQTSSMTITAAPRADGIVKASTTATTKEAVYAGWYQNVLVPPASVTGGGSETTPSTPDNPTPAEPEETA